METDFLNFHDGGQFSEFASNFDQYDFSDSCHKSRMVVDNDFDYIQSQRAHESFWEIEQELNGDMAVLPVSGVSSQMPKIENMNQDFVNSFNDWSEHIGCLQENDELITLANNLPENLNISFSEIFADDNTDIHISPTKNLQEEVKITPSPFKNLSDLSLPYLRSPIKENPVVNKLKLEPEEKKIDVKENYDDWVDKEEGCIDVETVSEYQPVLEARDVKSLLEQFEASEANLNLINPNSNKKNVESSESSKPSCEINKALVTKDLSKSLESTEPQISERHKNIRDSLPKEVIDRINASARKKVISVIPALSTNTKNNSRNNNRTSKTASTVRIKGSKTINQNSSSAFDTVIQNDHTYCTNSPNSNNSSYANNLNNGQTSKTAKGKQTSGKKTVNSKANKLVHNQRNNIIKRINSWTDSSSKKDSGLESGDVSDASEELATKNSSNSTDKQVVNQLINKRCTAKNSVPVKKTINVDNKKNQQKPIAGMKIHSALATSILQMRNGVLTKTKSVDENILKGKMVSVLKKPPVNNKVIGFNENIITTKNSLNGNVQNIIVQDATTTSPLSSSPSKSSFVDENEKKPPKRKLNLAEYRSRRDQNSDGNSRTSSPIQPMTLIYIHHASTTTEPIKSDPDNPIWSEREIVSMLKPKNMIVEPQIKPTTRDASVQTYETVFENPNSSEVIVEKPKIEENTINVEGKNNEKKNQVEKEQTCGKKRSYRQHRALSSSRSRSRSHSRSNSIQSRSKKECRISGRKRVNRSRSHNKYRANKRRSSSRSQSRSQSRSRSRSRSLSSRRNIRRRKISHRRSSVSSNSSWSSRSRSRSTYRSRSFSRSSRSRSRSRSFRSRSRSRSRYSSGTRSPSYTRNTYNTWHNHEKTRQVEERRVIYVGRIDEGITKADLRKRFEAFGPVLDISLHFREHGDNYGFVTFANKNDAYNAVEHGNDDHTLPRYDLSFGGRRAFCKVKYADLDGASNSSYNPGRSILNSNKEDDSFDFLLKEVQAKLRNRKV